jgi:hypothetical protein
LPSPRTPWQRFIPGSAKVTPFFYSPTPGEVADDRRIIPSGPFLPPIPPVPRDPRPVPAGSPPGELKPCFSIKTHEPQERGIQMIHRRLPL